MTLFFALISIYFLIIILLSLFKSPKIESPLLNLFKPLFPSWKFFDESVDTPLLYYRTIIGTEDSEWIICVPHAPKKWFHLFINPSGNFYLAYHSHIQQLLGELDACTDEQISTFHKSVSYQMTENFVRYELQRLKFVGNFQFKISAHDEDILLSPKLTITSESVR